MPKPSIEPVERPRHAVSPRAVNRRYQQPQGHPVSFEARCVAEFWRDALDLPDDVFPMFQSSLHFDPLID